VPPDFKGRYRVKIDMDLGPFAKEYDETWHSID